MDASETLQRLKDRREHWRNVRAEMARDIDMFEPGTGLLDTGPLREAVAKLDDVIAAYERSIAKRS